MQVLDAAPSDLDAFLFKAGVGIGKMSEFRGNEFWLGVVGEHL